MRKHVQANHLSFALSPTPWAPLPTDNAAHGPSETVRTSRRPPESTPTMKSRLLRRDDSSTNCGSGGGDQNDLALRVASVFVILAGSSLGALFPVLSRRTKWLGARVPKRAFDTAKYFGSGVIVSIWFTGASPVLIAV